MFNESTDDKPYAGETPDDKPGDFVPIGGSDKRKLSDGSIWSPDKAGHAGSKWKRWPNERRGRAARVRSRSQLGQMVVCVDYE
jgi:hypothetical protein